MESKKKLIEQRGADWNVQQNRVELGLRPQTRLHHKVKDDVANMAKLVQDDTTIPSTYKQAVNSSECAQWKEAMNSELCSLANHNVWEIVDRPKCHKVIKSKWVFSKSIRVMGAVSGQALTIF